MSLSELREGVGHTTYKVLQGKRGTIKLAYLHPCRWRRTAPPSGNQARSCSAQSDRGGSLPRTLSGEGPTRSEGDTLHLYVGEHFVVAIYRTHTRSQKILLLSIRLWLCSLFHCFTHNFAKKSQTLINVDCTTHKQFTLRTGSINWPKITHPF